MREEDIISQLVKIVDDLDMNEIGLKKQFQEEVDRFNKFQRMVLEMNGEENKIDKMREFDIRMYAKYVLKEGSITEKRELLAGLTSRLIMENKVIRMEKAKNGKS